MTTALHYGQQSVIRLDLPLDKIILDRRGPAGEPLDDPAAAVAAALAEPLDFPPLARAITVDDRVALPLAPGVPQAEAIIAGAVYALTEAGIAPGNITIIYDPADFDHSPNELTSGLPEAFRQAVAVARHDPGDRGQLAYLAADEAGEPIYFHRAIGDADVVIPIGCLRGGRGETVNVSDALYPTFADASAQRRFRSYRSFDNPQSHQQRRREADEAAWLLGVLLSIAVVPGEGDSVLQVLVGERRSVAKQGESVGRRAWAFDIPQRAELVVATVEGGPRQQTWENLGRALWAASQCVADEGAIALCCELEQPPGPSLQRLTADRTGEEAIHEIRRDAHPDTITAALLWQALQQYRVYLRSNLDEETVESLGMAYVSCDEEIARLSRRHDSCIFIGNAQYAAPNSR